MMTHEREFTRKLNKLLNLAFSRIAFKRSCSKELASAMIYCKTIVDEVPGCNGNRVYRLAIEKKIKLAEKLIWGLAQCL